jgi:hypothetical protein
MILAAIVDSKIHLVNEKNDLFQFKTVCWGQIIHRQPQKAFVLRVDLQIVLPD